MHNTCWADGKSCAVARLGYACHQVLLQVKDVQRSRDFYTKKAGFKVLYDFSPEYVAVITPNRLQIGLHPFPRGSRRPDWGTNYRDRV
ncbi:VOC family protein [Candidatus Bathyarchaeota archaeon]|nr:MAG: VOC family protein [Candidatus Bathyarchaeota archaeon]